MCRIKDVDENTALRDIMMWLEIDTHMMNDEQLARTALKLWCWIRGGVTK